MLVIIHTLRRLLARFKFAEHLTTSAEPKPRHQREIPKDTVEKESTAGTEGMLEKVPTNAWDRIFRQEASWAAEVQNYGFEIILMGRFIVKTRKSQFGLWSR